MRTGEGFLAMLGVLKTGDMSVIGKFLQENPSAQAHVARKQEPVASYADDVYYGVNAFKLVSASGEGTYVRWRFEPVEGVKYISGEEYEAQGPGYLREELASRLPGNPIKFRLVVQVAEEGDVTDDATVHWPEERKVVELGVLELNELLEGEESLRIEKNTIYDPIPRVEGVEPSADPLLEMRAAVYLMSGKERRAA
jgi:catalase